MKIKKDHCGLYVVTGGYICRPFFGTCFKEGDEVKGHHFGGSTNVGVGIPNEAHFRKDETFEFWATTGCGPHEKKEGKWKDPYDQTACPSWEYYVGRKAGWYQFYCNSAYVHVVPHNKKYALRIHKNYQDSNEVVHPTVEAQED